MNMRVLLKQTIAGRLIMFSTLFAFSMIMIAAVVLWFIVTSLVREQVDQRLDVQLEGLRNALSLSADGKILLKGSFDGPPFDQPTSGWYWQIKGAGTELSSRSLSGTYLEMASPRFGWANVLLQRSQPAEGVNGSGVRLHFRTVNTLVGDRPVAILAAAPRSAITVPALRALAWLIPTMATLGAVLIGGIFLQVRYGLKPLRTLTSDLVGVRAGQQAKLQSVDVKELVPIVNEVNRLIDLNEARLTETRVHFANIAHSLKTPVASLQLALTDRNDPTSELRDLVDRIEMRLRHHLARARSTVSAAGKPQATSVGARIDDVLNMMRRLYAERGIAAEVRVASEIRVACSVEDLEEILGNVIDNAFKWARSSIAISVEGAGERARITVVDDGPGVAGGAIEAAMKPGVRIDEAVPGHGFGLSISKELAELYGGSVRLESAGGGLIVVIELPLARA